MKTQNQDAQLTIGKAQFIAFAIILSPAINLVVCLLLDAYVPEELGGFANLDGQIATLLFPIGLALSIAHVAAAHIIRRLMIIKYPEADLPTKMRITTISMMLAETGSILGVVYFILTGRLAETYILLGLGFAAAISLFPTRRWLEK